MTVQQEHPTAVAEPTVLRLPEQRTPDSSERVQPAPPAAPQLRGWGSPEDRTMAMWLIAFMVFLGLFAGTFVALGARVFG